MTQFGEEQLERIADGLMSIADAIRGHASLMGEVFASPEVGRALEAIALGNNQVDGARVTVVLEEE